LKRALHKRRRQEERQQPETAPIKTRYYAHW
jgi:hypothetical protein